MADNTEDRADTHIMLLCVDETEVSERMVELYLKDFYRPEHQVVLINVYAKNEMSAMGPISSCSREFTALYEEHMKGLKARSISITGKFQSLCRQHGVETFAYNIVSTDSIGRSIVRFATQVRAEGVFIGGRKGGRVKRALFGSVCEYVMHNVGVPTLVVPAGENVGQCCACFKR